MCRVIKANFMKTHKEHRVLFILNEFLWVVERKEDAPSLNSKALSFRALLKCISQKNTQKNSPYHTKPHMKNSTWEYFN